MANSYPNKSNTDYFIPHGLIHILEGYNPVVMPAAKGCWSMIHSLYMLLEGGGLYFGHTL